MTYRYPWEVAAAIKARGGRFELTGDRSRFYVRGTRLTEEERDWVLANRDYMLLHVQHLHPPESFLLLKRSGQLNIRKKHQ